MHGDNTTKTEKPFFNKYDHWSAAIDKPMNRIKYYFLVVYCTIEADDDLALARILSTTHCLYILQTVCINFICSIYGNWIKLIWIHRTPFTFWVKEKYAFKWATSLAHNLYYMNTKCKTHLFRAHFSQNSILCNIFVNFGVRSKSNSYVWLSGFSKVDCWVSVFIWFWN